MCCYVLFTPLLYLPLLEKGIIEISNGKISVRRNLSDLLKAPPRDDVVEADESSFMGGNGIIQKLVPDRVDNITSHNKTTPNHMKILTHFHS